MCAFVCNLCWIIKKCTAKHTLRLDEGVNAPAVFPPGERTVGTNRVGGWLGPGAGLYVRENRRNLPSLPGIEHCIVWPVAWSLLIMLSRLPESWRSWRRMCQSATSSTTDTTGTAMGNVCSLVVTICTTFCNTDKLRRIHTVCLCASCVMYDTATVV